MCTRGVSNCGAHIVLLWTFIFHNCAYITCVLVCSSFVSDSVPSSAVHTCVEIWKGLWIVLRLFPMV